MLARILEPEVMDAAEDAREYDSMDHAAVNTQFIADLLDAIADRTLPRSVEIEESQPLQLLDLGAGTALIPIGIVRREPALRITAVDAAESMLKVARENITAAGQADRIELVLADAKMLPFNEGSFPLVVSNSIVHHVADPGRLIAEAIRVTACGGVLFHRDLARPHDESLLEALVNTYAAGATAYQRRLFSDSLRAALTIGEVRELIAHFGFARDTVQMTSDRHWTWSATKPA